MAPSAESDGAPRVAAVLRPAVRLLHDESSTVDVQVRLMSDGRLRRYARQKYATINGRLWSLWSLWQEFIQGVRSTSSLLRAASRLQLPNWLA